VRTAIAAPCGSVCLPALVIPVWRQRSPGKTAGKEDQLSPIVKVALLGLVAGNARVERLVDETIGPRVLVAPHVAD
jgi:hypothetical protein